MEARQVHKLAQASHSRQGKAMCVNCRDIAGSWQVAFIRKEYVDRLSLCPLPPKGQECR